MFVDSKYACSVFTVFAPIKHDQYHFLFPAKYSDYGDTTLQFILKRSEGTMVDAIIWEDNTANESGLAYLWLYKIYDIFEWSHESINALAITKLIKTQYRK